MWTARLQGLRAHGSVRSASLLVVALAGAAAVLALLVGGWWLINPVIAGVARIEADRLPRIELLQRARYADLEASIALRNALLFSDAGMKTSEVERFLGLQAVADEATSELERMAAGHTSATLLAQAMQSRRSLQATRSRARLLVQTARTEEAEDAITAELQGSLDAYLALLQKVVDHEERRVGETILSARRTMGEARSLLLAAGLVSVLTMAFLTVAWRRQVHHEVAARDRQIEQLRQQRDALVREVHHRIKNHLQGLLGLIEDQRRSTPPADGLLATLHGHVLALVGIHGLQASRAGERVYLHELVSQQVRLIQAGFPGARIDTRMGPEPGPELLDEGQAVPLALVVTELIVNAIKHGTDRTASVEVRCDAGGCRISVSNALRDGKGATGWEDGAGSGLALVSALVEGFGTVARADDGVRVTMTLEIPHAGLA